MTADPHSLGFQGLLAAGMTPADAWQAIHDDLTSDPAALAIIRDLDTHPKGQEALAWSRREWADHGLPPPWEERQ